MSTNGVNNSGSSSMMIWQSEAALAAELGGDVNAQVAAMMLKHGHDKRANAREMRHSEEDRLRSFEGQQVAKLREQAKHVLEAATRAAYGKIASGGLQVAAGAVTIGSAGASARADAAGKAANDATEKAAKEAANRAQEIAQTSADRANGLAMAFRGAGTGAEGGTELWAASANAAGKRAEIASTEASHRGAETKRRMDDLRDEEQGASEIIKRTFDFLKEAGEAKAGIERATLASRV
jgi:hypothetical protein